jgi:hypothetical protein
LLAGIGAGVLAGPEVARSWRGPAVRHEPQPDAHERLCDVFSRRVALYGLLRSAITGSP